MLTINPNYKISYESIPFGFGEPQDTKNVAIIIDDFLLNPELAREYAISNASEFKSASPTFYPGSFLAIPTDVSKTLIPFFDELFRKTYDLEAKKMSDFVLKYSLLSTKPENLTHLQTICHRDINPSVDLTKHKRIAAVLYLFEDEKLGGTSFYTKKNNLIPKQIPPVIPPKYLTVSDDNFELTNHIPAKWNRLVFYPSHILHSGYIDHPELLSEDPSVGRLTINNFTWYSDPESIKFE